MAGDRLTTSLSESILTVLCFSNDPKADLIASLVEPDLFEVYFREICSRVLEYRQTFKQAPGTSHIDDIFDFVLNDPKHRLHDIYRRILQGLYEQSASGFNTEYIASRVTSFIRQQTLKSAVLEAAQAIQKGGEDYSEEVESILLNTIQRKVDLESPGIFLGDKDKALSFLDEDDNEYCQLGIPELDKRRLCPTRKELLLYIGSRKSGKSQFVVHSGKMALLQRWKVAHITLEMSEEMVTQRYFQTLFSMSKRPDRYIRTAFEYDELKRLIGFDVKKVPSKLNLQDPLIRKKLLGKMGDWGIRLNNIVIKQFPSGSLTIRQLESYLDSLEIAHKFIPDLIIVDYAALMKLDADNYTHSLGQTTVALRGLAVKRNAALITPAQGNRESEGAAMVDSRLISGDISMVSTADTVFTYSQTAAERTLGLARLYVANARSEEDHLTILLSQDYSSSQFCLDSALMSSNYNSLVDTYGREGKANGSLEASGGV